MRVKSMQPISSEPPECENLFPRLRYTAFYLRTYNVSPSTPWHFSLPAEIQLKGFIGSAKWSCRARTHLQ